MKTTITQNQIFRNLSRLQRSCCSAVFLLLFLLSASSSWGQIAQRGTATTNSAALSGSSRSLTINKPTGVVAGDVLIASIVQNETDNDNGGLSANNASGWTLVSSGLIRSDGTSNGDNAWFGTILYRIADGAEGSSFSFNMPNDRADMAIGSIVAFSGVATNALRPNGLLGGPFDIVPGSTLNNNNSSTPTATGVNIVNNNSAVVMIAMVNDNNTVSSWSNSMAQLFDNNTSDGDDAQIASAWTSCNLSGATGNRTVTISGSDRNSAILLALRSATVVTVGTPSTTPTLCQNTALTNITHTTDGATGISNSGVSGANGLPAGVSASYSSNTITISGTPTASGTFNYSIPITPGCVVASGTITVSAPNAATISYAGTPFCKSLTTAQSVTRTGTTGGTYTASPAGLTINASTGAITPSSSTEGTYTITYTMAATGCSAATATTSVTITAAPSATISYAGSPFCNSFSSVQAVTRTGTTGGSYSSTVGLTIDASTGAITPSTSTAGTYTVIYTMAAGGGCAAQTATTSVTVNPSPSNVSASTSLNTICAGDSVNLTSSATSNSNTSTTLLNENFNGSATGWTTTNTSSGGTPANAAWTLRANGYSDGNETFNSNDASQFYLSNSDLQGSGGTTSTTLQSPPFSTQGLSAASLTFFQYYRYNGTETAVVQISTNGSNWINLNTAPTATIGARNGFVSNTLSLNAYLNQPTVYIRFKYDASFDWYWAIDNVSVTGTYTTPPAATFAWTASPSGFTSAVQNPTSVTPSSTTTYTVTATNSYGCSATASTTVTVNELPVATISAGSAITFCTGGSVVLSANTGSGLSYQWKLNGTNITGATASSYTAEASGSYTVTVTNSNNCSATSYATTVTVNTLPNQATATSTNSCGTATLVADGGSASVTWYSDALGTTPVVSSGNITVSSTATTSTLTIVNPTVSTTYYAYTFANGCRSQNNREAAVELKYTNTYTGTGNDWFTAANWSCGIPNANSNVVIPTGKTVSIAYRPNQIAAAAYTVTLQGNASLTVTEDHNLTVTNKVTVATGATFTVENDASLVQTDNVTNEGNITVQKSTPSNRLLKRFDAVLWSSPVVQNLLAISPTTAPSYFMEHNPQANSWSAVSNLSNASFTKGKGFLVRTPSTFPTTATQQWNVTFTGVPNNGNVTISAGSTGNSEKYLLVGNPYPSAISIAAFRAANPNITGVFYFFRKPNGVTGISSYGTLSVNNSFSPNDDAVGAVSPGDVIPSGQGFFVAMKSDNNNGEVYFTNAMRVANNHGTFNRMNTNLDTYRLIVQTPVGGNSQFITNYDAETTSGYDVGYDAIAFTDGTTDLSMIMNSKNYRIQSRGQYNAADVIPVQFKTATAGEHRIKLQDAQGVFAADQMVIIKDNLTGVQHNLTANGDYVFTATAGTFTNRFEVIYQQAYYTALQANSCGSTIANMNSLVYADIVNGATGYRFKVVNNTTSAVQTIDRPQHWFAFNMLSAYDYNTPYTISVQVQKDGVWTGYYGATCTVNSPNIAATGVMQINPSQCGATLATLGTVIATTPVAGATGYKFRITNTTANASGTNMVQEITRSNHWFTLAMLSRYSYGSSYTVEVAVKTTGAFTPYGNACTVYSPAVPTLATCGQTVATATTLVRTTAMNLATQYRFQVTRMSTQETITFDTANYWFSFRVNVPGYAAGEQYAVRVAVMTAGAWSPYGDACDITAPIATARTTEEAAPSEAGLFKPVAYPNPFASTFGISLATPSADVIHVMVYDLQGRLIEKQNVFVSELDSLQIGTNYPSGDYLLVVAQGANIKSSHIHKD